MCEGVRLPHSGHSLSCGFFQRLAPRRMRCFILEVRRFGTAMVQNGWYSGILLGTLEGVERVPAAVAAPGGRDVYIILAGVVHR